MNYELRPPSEFTLIDPESERQSNGNAERSRLLLEFNNALVSQLDLQELLKSIFEQIKQVFRQATAATLAIYDPRKNELRIHLLHSDDPDLFSEGMPLSLEHTPSGLAFRSRQTVLVNKLAYEDFPSPLIERALADGLRSACSVPLISPNQVVGTLTVAAVKENAFSLEEVALLTQVGQQIAVPIENAINYRLAKKESDRSQVLQEVGQAIVSTLNLRELFRTVSASLQRFINHDAASVVLVDQESGELRVHMLDRAPDGIFDEGAVMPWEGTPPALCIKTRKSVKRDTLDFEEFTAPQLRMAYDAGLRCGCSVPLIAHDQVLGTINVGANHEAAFTDEDVELLEQIAKPVAVAIENALNLQRAERERDRFQLMLEINNAVVSHLDLKALVKTISASLRDIMPHDAAGIALYEPEFNHLREYTNVFYTDVAAFRVGDTIPLEGTPAGQVFVTGEPLLVKRPNPEQYPADRYSRFQIEDSPKSACLALLSTHGHKLGIAGVSSTRPDNFNENDLELFAHVCDQIAIAVQNSLNYEQANRERVRARMLLEINNAITTNLDLHDLIQATSACLRNYFSHDFAGVALYDDEIQQLRVHSIDLAQPDKYLVAGQPFVHEGTFTGLAFTSGEPVVRNRFDPNETSWSMARKFHDEHGLRAMAFVPMIWGDRTVGVLNLGCRREDAFSESDVELLTHIAGQVAIAFQNSLNFQRAKKAQERTQTLLEATNAITTTLDLRELLRTTSSCLRRYFNHDVTGLALYDESTNKLMVHAIDRNNDSSRFAAEGTAFPIDDSPLAQAFVTGEPILEWRLDVQKFRGESMKAAYEAGWRSGACIPLIARERTLGVLGLASLREDGFSKIDADLLVNIADQVALAIENVLQYRQIESLKNKLASEKGYLEEEIKTQYNFAEIVGQSSALKQVLKQVETVAPTDSTVLLIGETGTGKELIARAIHNLSSRNERTLVKLNCAAIPTGLLESELFGHEKGAFTGAVASRVGRFELAHQGTLLLDEIGEIPLDLQPKLLRVLQEHEFERLGSSRTIKTDARLIAATNCDLAQMVQQKTFRSDLFYRLNVFPVMIPPLRERGGDIPLLVGYFAQKHAARMNKHIKTVPAATMEALCSYHWPGNVRELENFIERSVILSRGAELESPLAELSSGTAVAAAAAAGDGQASSGKPKLGTMEDMERSYIEEVLRHANGMIAGKGGAAEILGLPSSTLRSRMKKLGIK
jgi:formate hydrogenlyase transcriptional activator